MNPTNNPQISKDSVNNKILCVHEIETIDWINPRAITGHWWNREKELKLQHSCRSPQCRPPSVILVAYASQRTGVLHQIIRHPMQAPPPSSDRPIGFIGEAALGEPKCKPLVEAKHALPEVSDMPSPWPWEAAASWSMSSSTKGREMRDREA
jgi:hypothetical protein